MYEAAFPLVSSCWWSERRCPSPKPEGCGMDFARAMFNFSNTGSLLECDTSEKDMNIGNGLVVDGFLMDELSELCEFSEDNTAAPARNADLSNESSRQSCEIMNSSSNATVQDVALETVGMFDASVERSMDAYLPSVKDEISLEWLSSFTEDTLIYGASNFGVDSFLLKPEDVFAPASPGRDGICHFDDQMRKDFQAVKSDAVRRGTSLNCSKLEGNSILPTTVPGRARSKRPRSGGRAAWSSPLAVMRRRLSPTNSLDSTSNALYVHKRQVLCRSTDSCGFSTRIEEIKTEAEIIPEASDHCSEVVTTPKKNSKKRKWKNGQESGSLPRRCAHCLSQKTPQWRLGPTGPKTLCNACGVRFKSGRLFPEYMPAKSPTFLSNRHSNSHKKVLEMRRRQEVQKTMQQSEVEPKLTFTLPRVDGADHPTDSMNAQAKFMSLENSECRP